jgi:hypothetical protein
MNKKWVTHEKRDWNGTQHDRYILIAGPYSVSLSFDAESESLLFAEIKLKCCGNLIDEQSRLVARKPLVGHNSDVDQVLTLEDLKKIAEKLLFDRVNQDFCNAKHALKIMGPNQEIGDWGMTDVEK